MMIFVDEMKVFIFVSICIYLCQGFCPDDIDLQTHQCQCDLITSSIRCSNLPNRCRTCHRYKQMFITNEIEILQEKALHFFDFHVLTIEFSRLKTFSTRTFANLLIQQNHHLQIRILEYLSPIIPTRLFENLILQSKAKLTFEIFNTTQSILTIQSHAFDGIKFNSQNRFQFSVHSANELIRFEQNAGSISVPSNVSIELTFSNAKRILFDEHSFSHITQNPSSQLILRLHNFSSIQFASNIFTDFHQFNHSNFHFSLANFRNLSIQSKFFNRISQCKSLFELIRLVFLC